MHAVRIGHVLIFKVYTKVKKSITKIKTICVGHVERALCKWELLQGKDQAKEEKTRSWKRDVHECRPTQNHRYSECTMDSENR